MNEVSSIEWLENSERSRERYNEVFNKVKLSNIPQIWDYGDIKQKTENSGLIRGIIKAGESEVGIVQILVKKKFGVPIAYRINRGPLFLEQYDTPNNHMLVYQKVRSKRPYPIPILVAPNIESSPENIALLTENKWKQWNLFGYSTGVIDLMDSIENIRKNFDSKWRNQLKASEKANVDIKEGFDCFDELINLYESHQKKKNYTGIPSDVLYALKDMDDSPLKVFYITNEANAIIAYDIFYSTSNFGLYFVGWNNEQGRKIYGNNLLLFNAVCFFKSKGVRWLDLGGIDYINTEENAKFKDGMHPKHIRLVGEFFRL